MNEDMQEMLRQLGVDPGTWEEIPEGYTDLGMSESRKKLEQLRNLLTGALEDDQQKLQSLREQVARIRHGGGS